jgi:hypothetical protein
LRVHTFSLSLSFFFPYSFGFWVLGVGGRKKPPFEGGQMLLVDVKSFPVDERGRYFAALYICFSSFLHHSHLRYKNKKLR